MEVTREIKYQNHKDIINLYPWILALKKRDLGGFLKCEDCGEITSKLDVHHKRYGKDVNYYDLEMLCEPCHVKVTREIKKRDTKYEKNT